jgi:2-keto-4-pentenoate hydratase
VRTPATLAAALLLGAAVAAAPAHAACLTDPEVGTLFDAYSRLNPAPNPATLSPADGECTRAKLNRLLEARMGRPIGYKAGLTNPAVQKRFNADAPVWGVLYGPMMLTDGAVVDATFGARPLFEADMLVRVADAVAIRQAKTPLDVLGAIDRVIPAIELPDLVVQAPGQLNGAAITAINVGARYFVPGQAIDVPRMRAERYQLLHALRDMEAVVRVDGAEVDRGKGSDVLGHPLAAVVWLVQDLERHGAFLKPGDLVSVGSFSRLLPPKAGQAVEVEFQGLPGTPKVRVSFK